MIGPSRRCGSTRTRRAIVSAMAFPDSLFSEQLRETVAELVVELLPARDLRGVARFLHVAAPELGLREQDEDAPALGGQVSGVRERDDRVLLPLPREDGVPE